MALFSTSFHDAQIVEEALFHLSTGEARDTTRTIDLATFREQPLSNSIRRCSKGVSAFESVDSSVGVARRARNAGDRGPSLTGEERPLTRGQRPRYECDAAERDLARQVRESADAARQAVSLA